MSEDIQDDKFAKINAVIKEAVENIDGLLEIREQSARDIKNLEDAVRQQESYSRELNKSYSGYSNTGKRHARMELLANQNLLESKRNQKLVSTLLLIRLKDELHVT